MTINIDDIDKIVSGQISNRLAKELLEKSKFLYLVGKPQSRWQRFVNWILRRNPHIIDGGVGVKVPVLYGEVKE